MQVCEQHILLFKAAKVFEVDRVIEAVNEQQYNK